MDDESHGSHVAGIIGAVGNNGYGVVGVNWNVRVAALRMCSPNPLVGCNQADQADAFAYAAQKGMKVVNGSFGGYIFGQIVADAIANAPNVLFVFAAGNDGNDNDVNPAYPCDYPSANVICVAASDQNDAKPSFSNYGESTGRPRGARHEHRQRLAQRRSLPRQLPGERFRIALDHGWNQQHMGTRMQRSQLLDDGQPCRQLPDIHRLVFPEHDRIQHHRHVAMPSPVPRDLESRPGRRVPVRGWLHQRHHLGPRACSPSAARTVPTGCG